MFLQRDPEDVSVSLGVSALYEVEENSVHIQHRQGKQSTMMLNDGIFCIVRGAVSVDIHPAWNESDVFSGNDIAIITLDR